MKRIFLILLVLAGIASPLRADEGMWIPALISQRIADMQAKGFKLSADDIYSVNQASLKDAVVLFGGGCTAEIVSGEGLLFTNHHCGYSQIQQHSSVEHDYLKDGFWAMNRSEELPNRGLSVSFLERMEDVTNAVLKGYKASMTEEERAALIRKNSDELVKKATADGKGLRANVEALYYGNQYFLFVYRVYRDVRLVGAPPSSIGKFGGDTDNWMWPRHTGDFSIFRVYADKDNNPAEYSPDNVPYRPKRFLTISRAGVKEGDFTFVYGCPGSTKEYVLSDDVYYVETSDPQKIDLRTLRLDIMKKYMDQSPAVRIQYSSKAQGVSNSWKKWQGEAKGLVKNKAVDVKKAYEARFKQWAKGTKYEGLVERLEALYAEREPYYRAYDYYSEAARPTELLSLASSVRSQLANKEAKDSYVERFFKDYYQPIDKEIFAALMKAFDEKLADDVKPAYFKEQMAKYRGDTKAWSEDLFKNSVFATKESCLALTEADKAKVDNDPAYLLYNAFYQWYYNELRPTINRTGDEIQLAMRDYMKAQMEFEPNKAFYPDANMTLRVAYGHVEGYAPSDAIYYRPVSTLKGIIEKDNPEIFDYDIPQTLRDIYAEGGHETQPVCFLATNHTSGGNSGSPVLNADGNLIGINFDRVWEGTMSDLMFDPEICRNISIDIRYLLFNIEHIGHASYLFNEMRFAD